MSQSLANNARLDQDLLVNVADADKRGMTVIRTLIHLFFQSQIVTTVNGSQSLFMGIQLASEDAFAAMAVPDPNNATEYPIGGWLYRDRVIVTQSAAGVFLAIGGTVELRHDLRSQRKLDRSEMIFSVENNAFGGTAFPVDVGGIIRVLYKLP